MALFNWPNRHSVFYTTSVRSEIYQGKTDFQKNALSNKNPEIKSTMSRANVTHIQGTSHFDFQYIRLKF